MNTLMVVSNESKKRILVNKKSLDNIKYMSFNELKNKLLFSYDVESLYEVIKNEGLSVSNANIILDNLYYLDNSVDEVKDLVKIYNYLESQGLIIRNSFVIDKIRNSHIKIYGRDFITREEEKLFNGISYSFENLKEYERSIPVYECDTLEDEVRNLAFNIVNLLRRGINADKIKVINLDDEARMCCEKIFPRYNIPSNIGVGINLCSIPILKKVMNASNIYDGLVELEKSVETLEYKEIYEVVLKVFNKYASLPRDEISEKIIRYELMNTKVPCKSFMNAVSEGDIDTIYDENEYLFVMGFNQGIMPRVYKDEDYLSDKVKVKLGMELSGERTLNEKRKLSYFFKHSKNVVISYKKKSLKNSYEPSSFLEEIDTINMKSNIQYDASNVDNKIVLSRGLDIYYKYGSKTENLNKLYGSYENINYKTYDNKFNGVKSCNIDNLVISSTSMDSYNRCAFRYYLNYILKIDKFEETFMQDIGNLIHYVLSKYSSVGFNLRDEWEQYINLNNLGKEAREKFFLEKLYKETEFIILQIKRQKSYSVLSEECYEKSINIRLNDKVNFKGIVDKILYNSKEKLISIIDYKTGSVQLDLSMLKYGIGLQFPVYLYLLNEVSEFKDYTVLGFYVQKIINSEIVRDENKTYLEQKEKNLYLQGYSLGEEKLISKMDSSYEDSKVIKGLKISSKGFYHYSKVLSREEMENIKNQVKEKALETSQNIINNKFDINPKRIDGKLVGCEFCDFKDICYMNEKNIINLESQGEENAKVD